MRVAVVCFRVHVRSLTASCMGPAMRSMGLTSIPDDIDDRLNVGTFVRIAKEAIQTDRIL